MLRQWLLFPIKLPYRVVRRIYRTVRGQASGSDAREPASWSSEPETGGRSAAGSAPAQPAQASAPASKSAPKDTGPGPRDVQISPEDIFALRAAGEKVTFVDVREPVEMRGGIVAGAVLMPSGEVGAKFQTLPKDGTLVLYCASGMRSTNAALYLHGQGHTNARSLVGGFAHWVRDNGEVGQVEG